MHARKRRLLAVGAIFALILVFTVTIRLLSDTKGGDILNEQQEHVNATVSSATPSPVPAETPAQPNIEVGSQVKVNQVGYAVAHGKIAIVEGELANVSDFSVVDMANGETVFKGSLSEPLEDQSSGKTVRRADFSTIQTVGQYKLLVDGAGSSYPFVIQSAPYNEALATLLRSYMLQRSGVNIDDPITGLKQTAGHLQDAQAEIFFDDGISKKGDTIDVSGGWYDAGDYGKYIPPAAVTVAQLLLAYDINPKAFPADQLSYPEGLNSPDSLLPHILEEVKYELEWMLRMQRKDGAVYHKVSGAAWTDFVTPESDTQTRYVFGMSTYGTAQFAGATALASRIYKPFDSQFSNQLLAAAEKAQSYLNANEEALFRQDPMQDNGSGPYGKQTDAEERMWALAELFRTTEKTVYSDKLIRQFDYLLGKSPQDVNWANTHLLGQWAFYRAEKSDEKWKELIRKAITDRAKKLVARSEADGYLNILSAEQYTWASVKSGAAYGCLLLIANEMEPEGAYRATALEQLHHVFGRSATGYSYVTGIGSRYPIQPHHRIQSATGVRIPGLVVGGPNYYGGDPDLDAVKGTLAPAMSYLDVIGSYSSNEYAIDYNAPVILLASFFANE